MERPLEEDVGTVSLQDIYVRLGQLESGQLEIRDELGSLTTEVRTGFNGGKLSLKDRVSSLEGRWNRLMGGILVLMTLIGSFEVWSMFFGGS